MSDTAKEAIFFFALIMILGGFKLSIEGLVE